jgi:hypothetical protein
MDLVIKNIPKYQKDLFENLAGVCIWYSILIRLVNYLSRTLRCEIT